MIKIENTDIYGWGAAIRGMRNPMNSWALLDSYEGKEGEFFIGPNDLILMEKLAKAGSDHGKFLRMITVTADITAPLYWWKEYDTYKVGTVANSCSTMHKIHAKKFTLEDFSHEHLEQSALYTLTNLIDRLNRYRYIYINGGVDILFDCKRITYEPLDKRAWWQIIQLLPSSYNQKRTVQLNYAVLKNIYRARKNHKLDEWREFCGWIQTLPYAGLITEEDEHER